MAMLLRIFLSVGGDVLSLFITGEWSVYVVCFTAYYGEILESGCQKMPFDRSHKYCFHNIL